MHVWVDASYLLKKSFFINSLEVSDPALERSSPISRTTHPTGTLQGRPTRGVQTSVAKIIKNARKSAEDAPRQRFTCHKFSRLTTVHSFSVYFQRFETQDEACGQHARTHLP